MFHALEQYRVTTGNYGTSKDAGNNGLFYLPLKKKMPGFNKFVLRGYFQCIVSNGLGWEHVSVCIVSPNKKTFIERTPKWEEMCAIKDIFWDESDICVQFHPDKKNYKNTHPFALHIWRRIGSIYELPNNILV